MRDRTVEVRESAAPVAVPAGVLWSLPNLLGIGRIAAAPVIAVLILAPFAGAGVAAFVLFAAASVSDILDGRIARAQGTVSRLGVFMDLTADKVLAAAVMIAMVQVGLLPTWIVALLIVREFVVQGVRAVAAASNHVMPARSLGKGKTFATSAGIGLLLLAYDAQTGGPLAPVAQAQPAVLNLLLGGGFWMMVAATVLSAASGVLYLRSALPILIARDG